MSERPESEATEPGEALVAALLAESEQARATGELGDEFAAGLDARFAAIEGDLVSLRRGVESGELSAPQEFRLRPTAQAHRGGGEKVRAGGPAHAARSVSRRGLAKAKRLAGPKLRAAERRSVENAGRFAEAMATRSYVAKDRARRIVASSRGADRLARVSPLERTLGTGGGRDHARSSSLAGGSWEMEDWAFDRLKQAPEGTVLHVECGDGNFVRRLAANGYRASGADPETPAQSANITRAGALEALASTAKGSLGALVLSGITDRLNGGTARALAHLASRRLQPGGVLIVVSAHPDQAKDTDVVSAELSERHALHPVTWCHLLARYGFEGLTVRDAGAQATHFGIAGRRQ